MSDNIIYDILNNENKTVICNYCIVFVIIIYIFQYIDVSFSIIIGLILFTCIVYYVNSYREINNLKMSENENIKFEDIRTSNNILKHYNKINDFLFYFLDFKYISIQKYNEIVKLLENFISINEACELQPELINTNYLQLIDIKKKILNIIDSYIFITTDNTYTTLIYNSKKNCDMLLDEYINNINEKYKQHIKTYGYNLNTKIIDNSKIEPINFNDFL